MALLDRFKSTPRWRHADSAVRAAAVDDLSGDEQEILSAIAREDEDAGVRRAAVAKLRQPATLLAVARDDADERVRALARQCLVEIASGSAEEDAVAALAGVTDPRMLAQVAKSARTEGAARAALERLDEAGALASVAKHAPHVAVRLEALHRLRVPADLAEVAMHADAKDVALAALERLDDPELLQQIATRAQIKVIARRARAVLRAASPAPGGPTPEEVAERLHELDRSADAVVRTADAAAAAERLDELEELWSDLRMEWGESTGPAEAARQVRVSAALDRARAHAARLREEAAERERVARERTAAIAAREELCARVDALEGEDSLARLDEARTGWIILPPLDGPEARRLQARFDRACVACQERHQRWQASRTQREALATQLDALAEAVDAEDLSQARTQWERLAPQWLRRSQEVEAGTELTRRFEELSRRLDARDEEAREARRRRQQHHLEQWLRRLAQYQSVAAKPDLSLKEGERVLKALRQGLDEPGDLPAREDRTTVMEQLRSVHAAIFPRVQELRDAEDWKRWANAGVQEELCARVEALLSTEDLAGAARQLRELRRRWSTVAAAPKPVAQQLWNRFKTAHDAVHARCAEHFAVQRQELDQNLARKQELCERVEGLMESTAWLETAREIQALQAEWRRIGPVPREQVQPLAQRFHAACDRFFTRRKEDLQARKQVWAGNQARKEALCERVEALADDTDWERAAAAIRQAQAEWRTIGPVKRTKSEALWLRFRKACDQFFERYKHRDQIALATQLEARTACCAALEALAAPPDEAAPASDVEVRTRALELWQQWSRAPVLPRHLLEPLRERFEDALARVVQDRETLFRATPLDVAANRARMEELCARVEGLAAGRTPVSELGGASAESLAKLLREALAANTIGGRVDEETRRRAAHDAVREAQAAWRRLGPVPGEPGRALAARFHRTCRRVTGGERPPGPRRSGGGSRAARGGAGAQADQRDRPDEGSSR